MSSARSVLVIDDHEDNRELIAFVLRTEGFDAVVAGDGEAGLDALARIRPCVILLDLAMPVMDGWEFRARQLADDHLRSIPVVLYSAHPDLKNEAVSLGANGFLTKPVDVEHLISVVKSLCSV